MMQSLYSLIALLAVALPASAEEGWTGFPDSLDYGIYWYTSGDNPSVTKSASAFDRSNPTLIFAHGWAVGTVKKGIRPSYVYTHDGATYATQDAWIADGFNVGLFHWNQFADEPKTSVAEAKIWTTNGPEKMRYLTPSGHRDFKPKKTIADLFIEELTEWFPQGSVGAPWRLAGHSLGGQLVLRSLHLVKARGGLRLPERVVLLDPYISTKGPLDPQHYLWHSSIDKNVVGYARELASQGILLEEVRSSRLSRGWPSNKKSSKALSMQTALLERYPTYCGTNMMCKHMSSFFLYFLSKGVACTLWPSASCSTAASRPLVGRGWRQTRGKDTVAVEDDVFRERLR